MICTCYAGGKPGKGVRMSNILAAFMILISLLAAGCLSPLPSSSQASADLLSSETVSPSPTWLSEPPKKLTGAPPQYASILTPLTLSPEATESSGEPIRPATPNATPYSWGQEIFTSTPTPVIMAEEAASPTSSPIALVVQHSPSPTPVTRVEVSRTPLPTPEPTPTPDKPESLAETTSPVEEDEIKPSACDNDAQMGIWIEIVNSNEAFTSGDEVMLNICASALLDGLAGFDAELTIQNSSIGRIISVNFPKFGLTHHSSLPNSTVALRAVDLADLISYNAESVLLASARLLTMATGTTEITVWLNQMDDEAGNPISLMTSSASLVVSP